MLSFPRSFFSTCFVWIAPSQKKNMGSTKKSVYVDVLQCWNGSDSFLGKHKTVIWHKPSFCPNNQKIEGFSFQWKPVGLFSEDRRPSGGGVISRYNHLKTGVTCQGFLGILATLQLGGGLMMYQVDDIAITKKPSSSSNFHRLLT